MNQPNVERTSLKNATFNREQVEHRILCHKAEIVAHQIKLATCNEELYQTTIREAHIREIYRLAEVHFTRLQNHTELTNADILELEKWINRAKSADGLVDIVHALEELAKYQPHDIRRNFYALVQRIIIGGAYHEKKKI